MLREMGRISVYGISLFPVVEIQIIEARRYKVFGFLQFFRYDFITTENNLGTNIFCYK